MSLGWNELVSLYFCSSSYAEAPSVGFGRSTIWKAFLHLWLEPTSVRAKPVGSVLLGCSGDVGGYGCFGLIAAGRVDLCVLSLRIQHSIDRLLTGTRCYLRTARLSTSIASWTAESWKRSRSILR